MKPFCLFFFLLCAAFAFAQKNFVSGYVISNKGDTAKGMVKDRKFPNETQSWQKINFIDAEGKKSTYTPDEIKEYGRRGRQRYRTLNIGVEAKPTFVELLEEGEVLLYVYNHGSWGGAGNAIVPKSEEKEKSGKKAAFYLSLQGISLPLSESKDHMECFLQQKNKPASLMQWRPRDYKQTARVFFGDNAEIMKLLEEGALDERDIIAIVKKYNLGKK
jgi:hypothetical protein